MMNIQEVADKLNGIQYGEEGKVLTLDFCKQLRREGIVVVRGYSDDVVEFDGAISDELGAYDHYVNRHGLIQNECDRDRCPYFERILKEAKHYVKPLWCEVEDYAWAYDTNISHVTFDVMEGEDKYCRGIVFRLTGLE